MEPQINSNLIYPNRISIDSSYIEEKAGILDALTYASAQYIYKVLERHVRDQIKWFDKEKVRKLRRTIIHKNAHLDEYFAELLFRAILPPHLKDIEVSEHILMSKEDDAFAKISWPAGVVFGIRSDETGGAKALNFFDEHNSDGTRLKPSCSQLVAEEYLGRIPASIQKVLDEVNLSDSSAGSHQYNLKNIISSMHDILFIVGYDEIAGKEISKYLTENWKRAITNACIVSMIFLYENKLCSEKLTESEKLSIERTTKRSLDYFIEKTYLSKHSTFFEGVKKDLLFKFRIGNHDTIDKAVWKNTSGEIVNNQILILHRFCFALYKCWGENLANLIMMHIWQIIFQQQLSFQEIKKEILESPELGGIINTKFGSIEKVVIDGTKFNPVKRDKDTRARNFKENAPFWIYNATITNPNFPNVATVIKSIINDDYSHKGNNGFGILLLHDKTINSKMINVGPTIPNSIWNKLSDKICSIEPECWFQLKSPDGTYADFLINRTRAHQDQLPSSLITLELITSLISELSLN